MNTFDYIKKPTVGQRVMWPYGTKNYTYYGEIGTVVEVREGEFDVQMDERQPWMGSKHKPRTEVAKFTTDGLYDLIEVYTENAATFRRLAEIWDKNADYERRRPGQERTDSGPQ